MRKEMLSKVVVYVVVATLAVLAWGPIPGFEQSGEHALVGMRVVSSALQGDSGFGGLAPSSGRGEVGPAVDPIGLTPRVPPAG